MEHPAELRFVTYFSPGIPLAFYEAVVDHVRRELGQRVSLSVESRVSGPVRGGVDPFSRGEADVGFMCAPSFFWLRALKDPPIELLSAAPVFREVRAQGRPVYFSEVIVHCESPVHSFPELRGSSWAYNDPCSLSGYYNLLKKLTEMGEDGSFFDRIRCSGSHPNSIGLVASGEIAAAAIDSNVLRIKLQYTPKLRERLRVIESWGPFPIQPVVLRSGLHPQLKDRLHAALLTIGTHPDASPGFAGLGLESFAPVTYEHYVSEDRALRECERHIGNTAALRTEVDAVDGGSSAQASAPYGLPLRCRDDIRVPTGHRDQDSQYARSAVAAWSGRSLARVRLPGRIRW